MSTEPVSLQGLLRMITEDPRLVLTEWGSHALIGMPLTEDDHRWAFKTRVVVAPAPLPKSLDGLTGEMVCWPIRRKTLTGPLGAVRLGRAPSNDVVLGHKDVSKLHARLVFKGTELFLEDADSANGTSLNGQRLLPGNPVPLKDNDRLTLGGLALRFREVATLNRRA